MRNYLINSWQPLCGNGRIRTDAMGNLEYSVIRDSKYPTLALVAHADTICIQITQCSDDGKFRFRSVGASPHMLLGQRVIILNENGDRFRGVIGFDPTSQYGQPKGLVFEDLWIDVLDTFHVGDISIGDLAVIKPDIEICGDFASGTAIDDRIGLFVISEVLKRFSSEGTDWPVNLVCVATVQEEIGLRGSAMLDFSLSVDGIIVLDVDYATDTPTPHEDQMGRLYLNEGPGILRKADNSAKLRKYIKGVANENGLPLQVSLGRFLYGGTDAAPLQIARKEMGNNVCNMTIPCRYMHSPVETVSLNDVAVEIEIILATLKKLSSERIL